MVRQGKSEFKWNFVSCDHESYPEPKTKQNYLFVRKYRVFLEATNCFPYPPDNAYR